LFVSDGCDGLDLVEDEDAEVDDIRYVNVRPDVLFQTNDANLAAFDANFDESGDPVRVCMLKAEIDEGPNDNAIDGAGEHEVGFNGKGQIGNLVEECGTLSVSACTTVRSTSRWG